MKRFFVLFILFLVFLSVFVFGAMDPYTPFCEHQGYKVEVSEEGTYCVFDDREKCDLTDFFDESCGAEYKKEFSCVEEGNPVFGFEQCCFGSTPYLGFGAIGQPFCKNILFQPEVWLIILIIVAVVLFYIKRKKK